MHALFAEARVSGMQSLLLRSAFCMVINEFKTPALARRLAQNRLEKTAEWRSTPK